MPLAKPTRAVRSAGWAALVLAAGVTLAACGQQEPQWRLKDVEGVVSDLEFRLQRAADEQTITESASRGKIRLLFFGYTNCPDVCPTTLARLAAALDELDEYGDEVRAYFVSVDPNRDTPERLSKYVDAFGPQFTGLTASESRLRELAKRYNVTFSYGDAYPDGEYTVTHSSAVFVFDREGGARLLATSMFGDSAISIDALVHDLRELIEHT